ncbi:MAG: hypothetical protein R3E12_09905 [Candidatus Eisenbacteria bacterium]
MSDDDLDRTLHEVARSYRPAPETPTERIWAAVEARLPGDVRTSSPVASARRPRERTGVFRWLGGAVFAGALAVVLFVVLRSQPAPDAPVSDLRERIRDRVEAPRGNPAFAMAAGSFLARADAFLTMREEAARDENDTAAGDAELKNWAESLLLETRLLLDSPASRDPGLESLLLDLELTLAEVSQGRHGAGEDLAAAEADRTLLMRIRFKTPAGMVSVGI